jgi:hypothetical protein
MFRQLTVLLNYKRDIQQSGVKKVVHLSCIGAPINKDNDMIALDL